MSATLGEDFSLHGEEISAANADALRVQGEQQIKRANGPVTCDLQGLQRANSVTVAVMLAWYRAAHLAGHSILFVNLSSELRNIIAFSGLTDVLTRPEQTQ